MKAAGRAFRSSGWSLARSLALLFAVSFTLRLVVCFAVLRSDVPLLFDESDYYARALAWRQIFLATAGLEAVGPEVLDRAYGQGHWPPLHPLVLGAALALGGPSLAVARLTMVVLSALTTLVVYRLARELVGADAAWKAGWLHALYPTFVAYSHLLWSETTYILLLSAAVLATVRARSANRRRERVAGSALAGLALGLAALTRAAALPYLALLPAWLALARRRGRLAGLLLIISLAVILPWQMTLTLREDRWVALSTLGGYNLALGNHPWVPPGLGSSWGHESSKARLRQALEQAGESHGVGWRAAARGLALEEIRGRPGAFARRSLERLRMLWAPDLFPLRHLFHTVYPPMPPAAAGIVALAALAAYLALAAVAVLGLLGGRDGHRGLILALVAAGMILPAMTVGMPRLHLPLLALLLPAAGHGLTLLSASVPSLRVIAAVSLALLIITSSLPLAVSTYLLPSSHYARVVGPIDRLLGSQTRFSDRVLLRRADGPEGALTVKLLTPELRFGDGSRELRWPAGPAARLSLDLFSDGHEQIEIEISSAAGTVRLRPIRADAWRRWRPSGLAGVEILWSGGGPPPE